MGNETPEAFTETIHAVGRELLVKGPREYLLDKIRLHRLDRNTTVAQQAAYVRKVQAPPVRRGHGRNHGA